MDDIRAGVRLRALRQRLGWRQSDLADRAGVTQDDVSRIERGRFGPMAVDKVRGVAFALQADLGIVLRWRGGDLDRLTDEGHATLVGRTTEMLRVEGWEIRLEVTFSVYGERGSIDLLGWHAGTRLVLVVEVKTELVTVEETLRKHDQKVRLATRVGRDQFAWPAVDAGRLLVLPSLATARRRVARQAAVMDAAYPVRGTEMRAWLRSPTHAVAGLLFVDPGARAAVSRKRIRCRKAA